MAATRLGIEQLSVFALNPVAFVTLAADLGCDCISMGLTSFGYDPDGDAPFSLRDDPALRRETIAALRDRGVLVSLGEGCNIRRHKDVRDLATDMDVMRELGAERINAVSMDPDVGRTLDQLALFAEMAAARGMVSTVEPCPGLTIADLDAGLAAVRHVGRDDFALLLDTMHVARAGTTPARIAALDPATIGYVQLCDAPLVAREPDYMIEAAFERMVPGEGELPLAAYLAVLPDDVTISLEVPRRPLAAAGIGPRERLAPCVAAARTLIDRARSVSERGDR